MIITNSLPYVILMTLEPGTATPILPGGLFSRSLSHVNPTLDKRTLFNVVDISDKSRRTFLEEAQKEAVDIASTALMYMDDPEYSDYVARWFGTVLNVANDVRGVLTNFVGANQNSEGSIVLGKVNVWQDDYWTRRGDDKTFCNMEKDGWTATAYYKRTKDHKPGMHFCEKFFEQKVKADYLADNCASIASHIDTTTTTRAYRGANVLHEFMHFEKIGNTRNGRQITDWTYGAYSSFMLKTGWSSRSVLIADTYVYYAMHIWLSVNCKRDFSFPRDERDD